MSMFSRRIKKGSTDKSVVLRMMNQISFVPQVSMGEGAAGIALTYFRQDATGWVSFAPAALVTLSNTHTDGGWKHIAEGYYRVDVPDAAFAYGSDGVTIMASATGVLSYGTYVELTDYNPQTNEPQSAPGRY